MKKKLITVLAAAAVLLTSGCGGSQPAQTAATQAAETAQAATTTAATAAQESETTTADNSGEDVPADGGKSADISGFRMKVNGSDGKMSISRAAKKSSSMGDTDTWTIFVYLCGTDLESGQGSATSDIVQMMEAKASDNVKFVLQTGGTSEWYNEMFATGTAERYVVQNGDVTLVDTTALKSMGDPDNLAGFLKWGISEYPAEKMGVVFWDHGGGSITGACFDELTDNDSLSLAEINTALSDVYGEMTDKFEFIGFDCCLMGTAETANILATYARYFYGSQETEPGTGWNYTAIGSFLAQDPSANGAELGTTLADSFYKECEEGNQENECTFTIIDLEKFDDFTVAFNDFSKELYEAALDSNKLSGIVRGVSNGADNFGGNNKAEGYTNMVDIGGIVRACSDYADGSAVLTALRDCITYNINGVDHKTASGLSVYYPLEVQGSEELGIFSGICISPYYLSLVDMIAKGYSDSTYTNDAFFADDGEWTNDDCSYDYFDDSYFEDYTEGGGKSSLITFEIGPTLTEDNIYAFKLDENGLDYTASIGANIWLALDDGSYLELGETYDIIADWESGLVTDCFDGYWISLPNGQLLATYIVDYTDDYTIYTSPVMLNGKRTNLRIRVYGDYSAEVEGAWDGINEYGIPSREIRQLNEGDEICPIFYLDDDSEYTSSPYVWEDGDYVSYAKLMAGEYQYSFFIEDVYGDYYNTEYVVFVLGEDGNVEFAA